MVSSKWIKKFFAHMRWECVDVVWIALNFRLFLFSLFFQIVVFFVAFPKLKTLPHPVVSEIVYYIVNCISIEFFWYASRLPHIEILDLKPTSTNRFDSIPFFVSLHSERDVQITNLSFICFVYCAFKLRLPLHFGETSDKKQTTQHIPWIVHRMNSTELDNNK